MVYGKSHGTDRTTYLTLDFETGEISGSLLGDETRDVERVIVDINRVVHGVEYSGFKPSYRFFDDTLNARLTGVQAALPGSAVRLVSWSEGFSRLIVHISGGQYSGAYVLLSNSSQQPRLLGQDRPEIDASLVAQVDITRYPARDGLEIPALVTAMGDVKRAGNAPLVVLPHGGPASYDRFEFDWLAQYLASKGYVVLQPQFRGSDGFGLEHERAGYGEWGRKMQTDLDDGVAMLVEEGLVDPERVCIVGASYGGYAALAAASFASDIYNCAASINGVSDLPTMLSDEVRDRGRRHWVVAYWERQFGREFGDRQELEAISPARHADKVDIPVLLIHGSKDTVVPIEQSRMMNRALKKADADVRMVVLKGEDHWLSYGETRLATLQALDAFLDANLPQGVTQ